MTADANPLFLTYRSYLQAIHEQELWGKSTAGTPNRKFAN